MTRKNATADWTAIVKAAVLGAGGSMGITLLLTALATSLVGRETVGESSVDALTAGILILSSIGGSLLGAAVAGHHRLQVCLATGGMYFLLLIGCTALLFDGVYRGVGVTALAILGGSGASALVGLKEGKRRGAYRPAKKRNW